MIINLPPQVITNGTGAITATIDGINIFYAPINTCGVTKMVLPGGLGNAELDSLHCPTEENGAVSTGFTMTFPERAPPGAYAVHVVADTQDKDLAFCIDVTFSL